MNADLIITLANALIDRDEAQLHNALQDMMNAGLIGAKDAIDIVIAFDA